MLWGTGGLGVQVIRDQVPMSVLTISAWRMVIAAVVLVVVVLLLRQAPALVALARTRPLRAAVVGGGHGELPGALLRLRGRHRRHGRDRGQPRPGAGAADGRREHPAPRGPSRSRLLVLAAALGGLVLVSATPARAAPARTRCWACCSPPGSGAAYAVATELGRPLAQVAGPLALTTATTTVGAVVLAAVRPARHPRRRRAAHGDPAVGDAASTSVCSRWRSPTACSTRSAHDAGSSAVIATLLEPVTAAVVAALLLDERLGAAGVVGTVLILAAVAGLGQDEEPVAVPPPA